LSFANIKIKDPIPGLFEKTVRLMGENLVNRRRRKYRISVACPQDDPKTPSLTLTLVEKF